MLNVLCSVVREKLDDIIKCTNDFQTIPFQFNAFGSGIDIPYIGIRGHPVYRYYTYPNKILNFYQVRKLYRTVLPDEI